MPLNLVDSLTQSRIYSFRVIWESASISLMCLRHPNLNPCAIVLTLLMEHVSVRSRYQQQCESYVTGSTWASLCLHSCSCSCVQQELGPVLVETLVFAFYPLQLDTLKLLVCRAQKNGRCVRGTFHHACWGGGRYLFRLCSTTLFIGPKSDHWLCLSLTHWLTD